MKKRLVIIFVLIPTLFISCYAQKAISKVFETKNEIFDGKLEITFCSEDILKYQITLNNKDGINLLSEAGYAILPNLNGLKKNGLDYEEPIILSDRHLGARQYQTYCKCVNWFNFKLPRDTSIIEVECGAVVIEKITKKQLVKDPRSYFLEFFYPKNSKNSLIKE